MLRQIKKNWTELRRGRPGSRFQQAHALHQAKHRSRATKAGTVLLGVAILAVGLVALPAPGPGTLVVALGLAFIARESRLVVRTMDWVELRLRAILRRGRLAWRRASPVQRVAVSVLGIGIVGAALYLAYTVTIGRA